MKQVPRVSAIASFVVDEQNQQNHIAHEALFQRTGNSECYNGIDYGGKKDRSVWYRMGQSTEKMNLIYQFKIQVSSWLSGILATEVMVLCLVCFEKQGQQKL